MIIWDLCSGLGGWTKAFELEHTLGIVQVYRFENNPLLRGVPFTHMQDVKEWKKWAFNYPQPDVIVASPPCLEFSTAYNAPKVRAKREGIEFQPDLEILHACKEIIDTIKPKWWIIENVAGASKTFSEELGMKPRQIIGPMFLWGYFPYLAVSDVKMDKLKNFDVGDPLRANKRALIPFEVSVALADVVFHQKTLGDFQ